MKTINNIFNQLPVYGEWVKFKQFINNANEVNYLFGLPPITISFMKWLMSGMEKDIVVWRHNVKNGFVNKPAISEFINNKELCSHFEYCEHKMCKVCLNQQRVYWATLAQHTDVDIVKQYYSIVNNDVKLLVRKSSDTIINFD